jgi:hypothetical protein
MLLRQGGVTEVPALIPQATPSEIEEAISIGHQQRTTE